MATVLAPVYGQGGSKEETWPDPVDSGSPFMEEDGAMTTSKRYPVEVRERAVRMVLEHEGEYDSQWAAISSVAQKLGMTPETLRQWVRRAEIDGGLRSGVTTEERARVRELEREVRELRRANEILKAAAAFFGAELDRKQKR